MLKSTKKTPEHKEKKQISSFGKLFRIFSLSHICEQ